MASWQTQFGGLFITRINCPSLDFISFRNLFNSDFPKQDYGGDSLVAEREAVDAFRRKARDRTLLIWVRFPVIALKVFTLNNPKRGAK